MNKRIMNLRNGNLWFNDRRKKGLRDMNVWNFITISRSIFIEQICIRSRLFNNIIRKKNILNDLRLKIYCIFESNIKI